jgi:hypothetical protein
MTEQILHWSFSLECSGFTLQMALVVLLHVFTKIFTFLCMGARAVGFAGYVCSTHFYQFFYPRYTHVGASSQFYCVTSRTRPRVAVAQSG